MKDSRSSYTATIDAAAILNWENETEDRSNLETLNRLKKNLAIAIESELTDRQREIITMAFFRKMRVTDIAEELRLSKSTVSRSLERAKAKLEKALKYSF